MEDAQQNATFPSTSGEFSLQLYIPVCLFVFFSDLQNQINEDLLNKAFPRTWTSNNENSVQCYLNLKLESSLALEINPKNST